MKKPAIILASVTAAVTLACSTDDDDPAPLTDNPAREADAGEGEEQQQGKDDQEAQVGSRAHPYSPGDTMVMDDWEVALAETDLDATEAVLEENQFNEIPDGATAVMVEVTATYTGAESGIAWADLTIEWVGGDSITYTQYDQSCGVVPNELSGYSDQYEGGTVAGNVCVAVPDGGIDGGVWRVAAYDADFNEVSAFISAE